MSTHMAPPEGGLFCYERDGESYGGTQSVEGHAPAVPAKSLEQACERTRGIGHQNHFLKTALFDQFCNNIGDISNFTSEFALDPGVLQPRIGRIGNRMHGVVANRYQPGQRGHRKRRGRLHRINGHYEQFIPARISCPIDEIS